MRSTSKSLSPALAALTLVALPSLTLVSGCGGDSSADAGMTQTDAQALDGSVGADSGICVPSEATWTSSISNTVQQHCGQCHGSTPQFGAPFAIGNYASLIDGNPGARLVDQMARAVHGGSMPPSQLPRMSTPEANALVQWASCGALTVTEQQGLQVSRGPWLAPSEGPSGLQTVDLLAREFAVPTGTDTYRCFVFDAPVTQDRFIRRFEMVFDETEVLHHLVVLRDTDLTGPDVEDYDCIGSMPTGSQYLYAWAPGQGAVQFPEGGLRIRAGERYIVQLHYNNSQGITGLRDSSGVRLYLDETRGTEYGMLAVGPLAFEIPARETASAGSYCTVREATQMLAGMPHMHEVGARFVQRVERSVGGARESIITVENWDFNAQNFYSMPVSLAPGDRIYTECTWTNAGSESVGSGSRTEDEMCFNFVYMTPPPSARYCDEGEGPPSDVPYVPGRCAGTPAAPNAALARATWTEGTPTALTGGPVPDGRWELSRGEYIVNRLATPVGTIDLSRTFALGRGNLWTSPNSIRVDLDSHVYIQSNEGPSFSVPNHIGFGGAWSPGASPATATLDCPEVTDNTFEYQVTGNELTLGFGPLTQIPGAQLWIRWIFTRAQ